MTPGRRSRTSHAVAPPAVVQAVAGWAEHLETAIDPARVGAGLLPIFAETSGATRASLLLIHPRSGRLRVVAALGLPKVTPLADLPPAPRRISDWVLRERRSLILNGDISDERFEASAPRDRIASAMSVPLPGARGVIGVMNLARVGTTIPFTSADLGRVEATAAALGSLFERVLELGCAREHWRQLAAIDPLHTPAHRSAGDLVLSRRAGALPSQDVFEQVRRGDGARILMLAEPFGPMVQSRLVAEWLRGMFRAIAPRHASVAELAAEMDERLRERNDGAAARAWLGCLGTTGQLASCAAGYPSPFCLPSEGNAGLRLLEGGPPLGTGRTPRDYEETKLRLLFGDALLVVSDGLLLATSLAGRSFGEEAILDHLHEHWPGSIEGLAQGLTEAACGHTGFTVPPDDVLALVLRYSRAA